MTIDLRFHPLIGWPVKATPDDQRKSRYTFRASWSDTLALLEEELTRLDARDIVISAALDPAHIRIDGWPRAGAHPRHPGIVLNFSTPNLGNLRYLTDRYEYWHANLRAIGLGLKALRAVDRYGITESGEQYKGWAAIEQTSGSTFDASALLLRVADWDPLPPGTTPKAIYKRALIAAHPDHGGTAVQLAEVMEAGRKLGVA